MAVIRCPQCQLPMTDQEALTGACPVCAAPLLPQVAPTLVPEAAKPIESAPPLLVLWLSLGAIFTLVVGGMWYFSSNPSAKSGEPKKEAPTLAQLRPPVAPPATKPEPKEAAPAPVQDEPLSTQQQLSNRLAEILNPTLNLALAPVLVPGQVVKLPEPKALQDVWVVPPLLQALPPRPGATAAKPANPRMTPEPLPHFPRQPAALPEIVLPTTAQVALPSIGVQPVQPIPILNQPLKDRASLEDATVAASVAATLALAIPLRDRPVPFEPMNLPDPFPLRKLHLSNPPPESEVPHASPARAILSPAPSGN